MKYLLAAILTLGWCASASAQSEVIPAPKPKQDRGRFLNKYERKIAALENYAVTLVEHDGKTSVVKSVSQKQAPRRDKLQTVLIPAAPKS